MRLYRLCLLAAACLAALKTRADDSGFAESADAALADGRLPPDIVVPGLDADLDPDAEDAPAVDSSPYALEAAAELLREPYNSTESWEEAAALDAASRRAAGSEAFDATVLTPERLARKLEGGPRVDE
jgi:hypothetical protein